MGGGTDLAMKAAAVVLMKNDLGRVVELLALSQRTLRVIRQNLFWSFGYNGVGLVIAAFGLLNPILASFGDGPVERLCDYQCVKAWSCQGGKGPRCSLMDTTRYPLSSYVSEDFGPSCVRESQFPHADDCGSVASPHNVNRRKWFR